MSNNAPDSRVATSDSALGALIDDLRGAAPVDTHAYERLVRRHPRPGSGFYSKSDVIRGLRQRQLPDDPATDSLIENIRMKPVRTLSGVAPVTVLTKPYPCPGRCIFCPSDVRMPKSYLSDEPGAQRAAQHRFDPYRQSLSRLLAYHNCGHRPEKIELIVLGGTWSFYTETYQRWFIGRCFDALNDFSGARAEGLLAATPQPALDHGTNHDAVDGRAVGAGYNRVVTRFARGRADDEERFSWERLEAAQRANERAAARCIGLSVETRPDHISPAEVERIRRLGATRVQIGIQSLSDRVLALNGRGHDVAATRRAVTLLRGAGFKIQAHWMANLFGATPDDDIEDFARLFEDPAVRPDELKIYPCSLIASAELMRHYEADRWRPYERAELLRVLTAALERTPEYCRLSRVIRDIPGTDIVAGSRETNLREAAEARLGAGGRAARDIRAREIRGRQPTAANLRLTATRYETATGSEIFVQFLTPTDRLAGFLRLALPTAVAPIKEIDGSAVVREVHVYGRPAALDGPPRHTVQHLGLGRRLLRRAADLARAAGYPNLAVISGIGTRDYYRRQGFHDGALYQHLPLS